MEDIKYSTFSLNIQFHIFVSLAAAIGDLKEDEGDDLNNYNHIQNERRCNE